VHLLSSQRHFAARVELGFYDRLTRLPTYKEKNEFDRLKPRT
jgi:hypothetical protein